MLGKLVGQRYVQIAKSWVPTLVGWGSVGAVGLVYATDWRLLLDYVPYIRGKFQKDE
ncbi:cytochrome b-c1 complex subunit 10 [Lepisosteus oculatus]|uniref:cytochrome b-c1 complex subunit 10 n=1 Tax=Lepisosteus oculatus TaxID=7918 RepID=UPI003713E22A